MKVNEGFMKICWRRWRWGGRRWI